MDDIYTTVLKGVECCVCHVVFGMSSELYAQRRQDHKAFSCPMGHEQHFTGQSDEEKLKKQVALEKQRRESAEGRLDTEKRRSAAYKGKLTQHKKAAVNGDCPVCAKHFPRLKAHMTEYHPDYTPKVEE